ncbi:hypothetical protein Tco_1100856, partial [Tanacetum coccineum]
LVDCEVAEKKMSCKSEGEHDLLWAVYHEIARRINLLTEVLDGLSDPVSCRPLDTTTLRELIDSNGRLITEEPAHGDPRVTVPRLPHHSIYDSYDRMGRMEIRQGELERMAHRQLYHTDRYEEKERERCRNSCLKATT